MTVSKKNSINKSKNIKKEVVNKKSKSKKSYIKNIKKFFKKSIKREIYTAGDVITVMLFSLGIGFIICFGCMSLFVGKNYFSVVKDLGKVIDTYYAIVDNYYGDLNKKELIDGAVEGMINSVDDVFTSYTDAENTDSFDVTINGNYEGIGATVSTYTDGSIVIVEIFEGSPSDKAGLKIGDIVTKVDNVSF